MTRIAREIFRAGLLLKRLRGLIPSPNHLGAFTCTQHVKGVPTLTSQNAFHFSDEAAYLCDFYLLLQRTTQTQKKAQEKKQTAGSFTTIGSNLRWELVSEDVKHATGRHNTLFVLVILRERLNGFLVDPLAYESELL